MCACHRRAGAADSDCRPRRCPTRPSLCLCTPPPCSWGGAWTPAQPPPPAADGASGSVAGAPQAADQLLRPDPRSTLHASVQLLARLTKDHALAERVGAVGRGCWVLGAGLWVLGHGCWVLGAGSCQRLQPRLAAAPGPPSTRTGRRACSHPLAYLARPCPHCPDHVQTARYLCAAGAPCPQVLAARGHASLLDLPPSVFKPELEPFIAAVFRHILEDPATLQVGGASGSLPLPRLSPPVCGVARGGAVAPPPPRNGGGHALQAAVCPECQPRSLLQRTKAGRQAGRQSTLTCSWVPRTQDDCATAAREPPALLASAAQRPGPVQLASSQSLGAAPRAAAHLAVPRARQTLLLARCLKVQVCELRSPLPSPPPCSPPWRPRCAAPWPRRGAAPAPTPTSASRVGGCWPGAHSWPGLLAPPSKWRPSASCRPLTPCQHACPISAPCGCLSLRW